MHGETAKFTITYVRL